MLFLFTTRPFEETYQLPVISCKLSCSPSSAELKMAMFLDAFMSKFSTLLTDFVKEEVIMLLGVKDELQKLQKRMWSIQTLLNDAEKKKFDDSSLEYWLSQLKDVMYDAEDIIDLCRIEGAQLLADQNPESTFSCLLQYAPVCSNLSSAFSCFTSVHLRHEIGNKIKKINERLNQIYEDRNRYKLEESAISNTPQITLVDSRKTSSMVDPFVVGREVEDAANRLTDLLVGENVDEKCSIFAVLGMGGIGKTTLAQKIFNHSKIQTYFNLPVWVCVSQTYLEIDLLKNVIREAKGSCGDANTKSELQRILRDSIGSGQSLFLVLDDVWREDVWNDLLRVPLYNAKGSVRVLVTTRDEKVAKKMGAAHTHPVDRLSKERSWDILRERLFSKEEEYLANDLKELGFTIVEKCGFLPLAIQVVAGVLLDKERTRRVWKDFLENDSWSINNLPEDLKGAIYLSFEDLPSHLKQCFLYFSLYPEDALLHCSDFTKLWVAEGFITEQKKKLMEDLAKECYIELVKRNLLLPSSEFNGANKMHDVIRSLAIDLSKGEASSGDSCVRNSTTSTKLRRLSISKKKCAIEILNSNIVEQEALRTLLASRSDMLLDDQRLRRLSHLRVLDISYTPIKVLPDSIGNLVHLRYLNLKCTGIREIPGSIRKLTNLQFLNIGDCNSLRQLTSGITLLRNLRFLDLTGTYITSIPKGIENMQQLNYLGGFVATNNDSDSKLIELNSLKQIRTLAIFNLEGAQSVEAIILEKLPHLSNLELHFIYIFNPSDEQELAVEELFDKIIPPQSLEELKICDFFGRRFPKWMALSSFEVYVPYLTKLHLINIKSCTQLPPLGQLPALRELEIKDAILKKIGPEFLGGGVNSTTEIAFPKLEKLAFLRLVELEEWSFGAQVEENASPRLKLLPCLQELKIFVCLLLKQLPKGLKHSSMKSLNIFCCDRLESVDNLPIEIEELHVDFCANLKNIHCPPTLKILKVDACNALSWVEKLDSLQKIHLHNFQMMSLPEWLLEFMRQRALQNHTKVDDFLLDLKCDDMLSQKCKEGGSYWNLIKHIPQLKINGRVIMNY